MRASGEKKIREWSAVGGKDLEELTSAGVKFNKGEVGDELRG